MRFVHEGEDDVRLVRVRLCELSPERDEVVVGRAAVVCAALADGVAVPAGVVVDVDYAMRAGGEAGLHEVVVVGEECRVKLTAKVMIDEILPADGEAEDVEVVVVGEVLHLTWADACWAVCAAAVTLRTSIVNLGMEKTNMTAGGITHVVCAAEIAACNIYSCELHLRHGSDDKEACNHEAY